jgi:hypothetical protein
MATIHNTSNSKQLRKKTCTVPNMISQIFTRGLASSPLLSMDKATQVLLLGKIMFIILVSKKDLCYF